MDLKYFCTIEIISKMKTLEEQIQIESEKLEKVFEGDNHVKDLKAIADKIKKLGLDSPKSYTLPPLDTI